MVRCAVQGCSNYQGKKEQGKTIRFFCFPKDVKQSAEWIRICGSDESLNLKVARVCSDHFCENDFKLQHLLLNIPEDKRKLKPDAVPSINVPHDENSMKQRENMEKKKQKELVEQAISLYNRKYVMEISEHFEEPEMDAPTMRFQTSGTCHVPQDDPLAAPGPEAENLRKENRALALHIKKLKKRLHLAETAISSLGEIFTEGQFKRVRNPNKKYKWSFDDISFAACLYAAGPSAYSLLRKKNYPLPIPACLKNRGAGIKLNPGLVRDTLHSMSSSKYRDLERLCILSFHEIQLKPCVLDEPREHLELSKVAHTVIARGLLTDWKQVVYYHYDCDNPAVFLREIIRALSEINFTVVAIVSGVGHLKFPLWPELKVDYEHPYVQFIPGKKVFFFGNVPHLIKHFRNSFVKYGVMLGDKHITTAPLKELIQVDTSDLEMGYKFSEPHISEKKNALQNEELIYQLLSRSLANAVRKCLSAGKITSPFALECSDIIQLFSDWSEVFNSKGTAKNALEKRLAYGLALEKQNSVISMMNDLMQKITKCKRKTSLPFQRGILLNNASLVQLYKHLAEEYSINQVATERFNQDDIEQMFRVKRSGTNFNCKPTALEFKYKINSILLSCLETIKKGDS